MNFGYVAIHYYKLRVRVLRFFIENLSNTERNDLKGLHGAGQIIIKTGPITNVSPWTKLQCQGSTQCVKFFPSAVSCKYPSVYG